MKNQRFGKITAVIVMVLAWSLAFSSLSPIIVEAQAQQQQRQQQFRAPAADRNINPVTGQPFGQCEDNGKPGTPSFYNNDDIRRTAKNARWGKIRKDFNAIIGGNPQVDYNGGEKHCAPLADEEDVSVADLKRETGKRQIDVEMHDRDYNIYLVTLPEIDKYGRTVYVRRKISTRKILDVLNCGNWTREVGAAYDVPPIEPCIEEFVGKKEVTRKNSKGENEYGWEYDYKCRKETVWETVTVTKEECPPTVCIPGSYTPMLSKGIGSGIPNESAVGSLSQLKNAPTFTVKQAVEERFRGNASAPVTDLNLLSSAYVLGEMERFYPGISDLRVKYLFLLIDPCPVNGLNQVLFHAIQDDNQTKDTTKRKWWKRGIIRLLFWIAIGAVAFYTIYRIVDRDTMDLLKIHPPKIRDNPAID